MNEYRSSFLLELKHLRSKKGLIVLLLFFVSLCFLQVGINKYNNSLLLKKKFLEIEKDKVKTYINYTQYGTYGIRLMFSEAPNSVFFTDSSVIPDMMTAYADSGERLKLYYPLKGGNIFKQTRSGILDFSGFLYVFGALLAMLYGWYFIKGKDYWRFLATITSPATAFFSHFFSRIAIMLLLLVGVMGAALLLCLINGIYVAVDMFFLPFLLSLFAVLVFSFTLGMGMGAIRKWKPGKTTLVVCWLIIAVAVPKTVNLFIAMRADMITTLYEHEMEKLKIVMDFEKKSIEEAGTFDYGRDANKKDRELIKRYLDNEYPKLEQMEASLRSEMQSNINLYHFLSLLAPTTHFRATINEISSRGYDNLQEFYRFVEEKKREFFKTYMRKIYFENFSEVEPFFEGDETVFHADARLPSMYYWGLLVAIVYISGLCWYSYNRFKMALHLTPAKAYSEPGSARLKPVYIDTGQYKVVKIQGEDIKTRFYNLLCRKMNGNTTDGFKGRLFVDQMDISQQPYKEKFLYICPPEEMPGDLKVIDFYKYLMGLSKLPGNIEKKILSDNQVSPLLAKNFQDLELYEKSRVLLKVMQIVRSPLYLVYNLCKGVPAEIHLELKDLMATKAEDKGKVIYITDQLMPESIGLYAGYWEQSEWSGMIERYRDMIYPKNRA